MSDTVSFTILTQKYFALGLSSAIALLISIVLLQYTRRIRGMPLYLQSTFSIFKNSPRLAIIATILYYIILITPIVLIIVWVALLGANYGSFVSLPVLFTSVVIVVLFFPTEEQYYYYYALISFVVFYVCQIVVMSVNWSLRQSSYFCLTAILFGMNGIIVAFTSFLIDGSCWNLYEPLTNNLKQQLRSKFHMVKEQNVPPYIVDGGIYYKICCKPVNRLICVIVLYVLSLLILLTYSLTVYYRTTFAYLGFINAVCVLSTDLIISMLIFITRQTNNNPILNGFASLGVRVILVSFSGSYWFLGYCLIYLVFMVYISGLMVNKYYPTYEKIPSIALQRTNIFKLPELACLLLMVMFGGLIYYLGNQDGSHIKVLSVVVEGVTYPFWSLGVAAILLSLSIMFYLVSLRIVQRSQSRIRSLSVYYMGCQDCSQYYFMLFTSWVFLIILGFYMYSKVGSMLIWVSCIFLPLFYQSFVIFLTNWAQNDYLILGDVAAFNKKVKKRNQRNKKIQLNKVSIIKKIKQKGGDMADEDILVEEGQVEENLLTIMDNKEYQDWSNKGLFAALKQGLLLPTDKKIIISVPLMIISLVIYSIAYYFSQNESTAFTISIQLFSLFLTVIPMKRYFSTLELPSIPQIISLVVGLAINYTYGIITIFKFQNTIIWTLWWSIIYIFILSLYATYSLLRDKGVVKASMMVGGVSCVLSLGVGIILLAGYRLIAEGIVLLGIGLYYSYGLVVSFIYIKSNSSLPWIVIPITIGIIICTCFAVMIYSFVSATFDDFYGFSITYLAINAMVLMYGGYNLLSDMLNRLDRPVFYSPYSNKVYRYKPEIQSVKENSQPMMVWLGGWTMFYFYTIMMQAFIADVNYGLSAAMIFFTVVCISIIFFKSYNSYSSGKIKKDITPQILDSSWKEILESKESVGDQPGINDLAAKLEKYRNSQNKEVGKVIPQNQQSHNESLGALNNVENIDVHIHDLQVKLSKATEDESIHLINFWIKILFKCSTIKKKQMIKFISFIKESEDLLAQMGVGIVLDLQLYDIEIIYNHAYQQYSMLSPFQKIQFDKSMKLWMAKKEEIDKKNQQLHNKQLEAEKKREEDLKKRLEQNNKDDDNLPLEKMRDSPAKLKKIFEKYAHQLYADPQFPANPNILTNDAKKDCKEWKRPTSDCLIIKPSDQIALNVKQGYIGDCYLISAIGVLGRKNLENILGIGIWQNPNGVYMVKFRKYGQDIYIIIDSQFPVAPDGKWYYGSCQDPKQLFTNIIQKAYAKLYGGYQNIVGGKSSVALSDMTGGFPEEIRLKDYQDQNSNRLFDQMIQFFKLGYLLSAGSPENPQGDAVDNEGIVQGHAYLVVNVRDLDGNKLIKLRNPHGNQGLQSKLDWSDNSPKWNKRLLNLLGEEMKQDGAFWMSVQDFVYSFRSLYVCRIFNPSLWKMVGPINGEWKGKSAAGLPTKKNPQAKLTCNPQYGIKVTKKSTLFIELRQNQISENRSGKNYIFFMVQRNGEKRIETFSANNLVGKSGAPINSVSISGQINLSSNTYPFTFSMMASTIEEGGQGSFSLTFYCDDLNMEVISNQDFQ